MSTLYSSCFATTGFFAVFAGALIGYDGLGATLPTDLPTDLLALEEATGFLKVDVFDCMFCCALFLIINQIDQTRYLKDFMNIRDRTSYIKINDVN